jgi:hypothetical protein
MKPVVRVSGAVSARQRQQDWFLESLPGGRVDALAACGVGGKCAPRALALPVSERGWTEAGGEAAHPLMFVVPQQHDGGAAAQHDGGERQRGDAALHGMQREVLEREGAVGGHGDMWRVV